jgi:hypothetical protein
MLLHNRKLLMIYFKNKKAIVVFKIITAISIKNNLKLTGLKEQ